MDVDPQKVFISVIDLFSVLMPGALVAYLGKDWVAVRLTQQPTFPLSDLEHWLTFAFASYLAGHLVFLLGATLDDLLYDRLRSLTDRGQIRRLAEGKRRQPAGWRRLATHPLLFGRGADRAVVVAERIKARALQTLSAAHALNAYQWSKIRLSKDHPDGLAAVQRLEADSKFFRSFVVVLTGLIALAAYRLRVGQVVACAALLILALWRYVEQRFKATQQAYWFVISLESAASQNAATPTTAAVTHAGGVVYRRRAAGVEFLLVQATGDPDEWVLPKGHIEPGENPRETAVREVHEESGYWARIVTFVDTLRLGNDVLAPLAHIYLLESVETAEEQEERDRTWPAEARRHIWLPLPDATARATWDDTKRVLATADRFCAARAATIPEPSGVV